MPELSREAKIDLALALLRRQNRTEAGLTRLQQVYPAAPASFLGTLAFHMFTDGVDALLNVLATQERLLRGEVEVSCSGEINHALYHLYNYALVEALLPTPAVDCLSDARDASRALRNPDDLALDDARAHLRDIVARLEGNTSPPDLP